MCSSDLVVAAPSNMRRVLGVGMLCVLLGVLLSSRADLHRLSVLAVPLAVLTGCGWGRIHFAWGTLWRNEKTCPRSEHPNGGHRKPVAPAKPRYDEWEEW